jgi:hypothetical protein
LLIYTFSFFTSLTLLEISFFSSYIQILKPFDFFWLDAFLLQ